MLETFINGFAFSSLMALSKETLENIKERFNLNIYEVKIWTALLSRGIAPAGTLAQLAKVPRSRSYDVLESLEKKGFIVMKLGKPIKYIAVQPDEILVRMQKHVEKEAVSQIAIVDSIKNSPLFSELELLYKHGIQHVDATELSGALIGTKNIADYLKEAIEASKRKVVISTTKLGVTHDVEPVRLSLRRAAQNGSQVTILSPHKEFTDSRLAKLNEHVLHAQIGESPGRFVLVDDETLVFMTSPDHADSDYQSAIWVKTPYFAKAFSSMLSPMQKR